METCVRGFSFMPESKIEELKYVESEALERTWRVARRERQKKQEQKIWEEFVNEQDIVHNISKEDPYQFLNDLPQECIKELLDIELQKMKNDTDEYAQVKEHTEPASSLVVEPDNQHAATLSDAEEDGQCNMFNIFHDDGEEDQDASGADEERCDDSVASPPCTVRERPDNAAQATGAESPDKVSSKSSGENVTNMIEGSIYCAKVKDLRIKINEELLSIIGFLEKQKQDILNMDPAELPKLMKRSAEFCARFNRVHVYQLRRQMSDIERNSSNALPFAQRTQFQAQLVRVSSLHQNLLHALQIFQKSLPQTACMRDSADMLRVLILLIAEVTRVSSEARPNTLAAATDLFNDSVQSTCDRLEETINEYNTKMSDYMNSTENTSVSCSRRSSKPSRGRKRSIGTWSKSGTKSTANTEARLSMYSLATLRAGVNARSTSSKDNQSSSGTSKMRASISDGSNKRANSKEKLPLKSPKKSPRSRRPLMRAPQHARPRRVVPKEQDVHTLVENVAPCASSHISREVSLSRSPKSKNPTPHLRSKEATPRTPRPADTQGGCSAGTPTDTPRNTITARNKMAVNSPMKKRNLKTSDKMDTPRNHLQEIPNDPVNVKTNKQETENTKPQVRERDKSPAKSPLLNENTQRKKESEEQKRSETPRKQAGEESRRSEKERNRIRSGDIDPTSCEVTRLVRQLCGGDSVLGIRNDRVGAKNAQLLCINGGSPRQPSTPQLLRILEETIQKKTPKSLFPKQAIAAKDAEKLRMSFNIPERVTEDLFQYRTKFVQHMLTSPMYANSAVGKPWEKIGSVSEKIIDELLLNCAREMELQNFVKQMFKNETC